MAADSPTYQSVPLRVGEHTSGGFPASLPLASDRHSGELFGKRPGELLGEPSGKPFRKASVDGLPATLCERFRGAYQGRRSWESVRETVWEACRQVFQAAFLERHVGGQLLVSFGKGSEHCAANCNRRSHTLLLCLGLISLRSEVDESSRQPSPTCRHQGDVDIPGPSFLIRWLCQSRV